MESTIYFPRSDWTGQDYLVVGLMKFYRGGSARLEAEREPSKARVSDEVGAWVFQDFERQDLLVLQRMLTEMKEEMVTRRLTFDPSPASHEIHLRQIELLQATLNDELNGQETHND